MEEKHKRTVVIIVAIVAALWVIGSIIGILTGDNESEDDVVVDGCYIGDTLRYEDIDITVTGITSQKNENVNSDYYGLNELKVYFTYKNNGTKDFDVSTSDIHIKTEDKGEKYKCTFFSGTQNLADAIWGETIIAGAEKSYNITFYVPYSVEEKKFIMCFDWGILSTEQEYHLYLSDGTNANYTPTTDNEKEDTNEELKQTIKNLQDDLYNIFKQYVYDQISGGMYYSDVQKLVDSAERQCKTALSQIDVHLDLSNGTYFPKWIATVNVGYDTYYLFYIEVECSTSYKVQHKYIGKYNIE